MEHVFSLYEVEQYEGSFMHGLFKTRKSALKSGLELKRKRVQQALDDYRLTGDSSAEWSYRHCWDGITLHVGQEELYD